VRGSEASHTVPAYCLGVLLGLGVLVYTLICIKRGYLLERDWRGGMVHITRTQQPLLGRRLGLAPLGQRRQEVLHRGAVRG
jgi:hypothetical protein